MEGENFKSGSEGSFLRQRLPSLPSNTENKYLAPDGGGNGGKPSWKTLPIYKSKVFDVCENGEPKQYKLFYEEVED